MSNLVVINPPFKFEDSLSELNQIFKPVEKFEVIYHSETLSKSTHYCFNLIGSICGYISARNKTDAMIERFAIIEEALRKGLQKYKIKIDETVKNIKERINDKLNAFKVILDNQIKSLNLEYRVARDSLKTKLNLEDLKRRTKTKLKNMYLERKKLIKAILDVFKDIFSNFTEYTRLNDEYLEMERNYINLIKM